MPHAPRALASDRSTLAPAGDLLKGQLKKSAQHSHAGTMDENSATAKLF